jgi:hypothetical protein
MLCRTCTTVPACRDTSKAKLEPDPAGPEPCDDLTASDTRASLPKNNEEDVKEQIHRLVVIGRSPAHHDRSIGERSSRLSA